MFDVKYCTAYNQLNCQTGHIDQTESNFCWTSQRLVMKTLRKHNSHSLMMHCI